MQNALSNFEKKNKLMCLTWDQSIIIGWTQSMHYPFSHPLIIIVIYSPDTISDESKFFEKENWGNYF